MQHLNVYTLNRSEPSFKENRKHIKQPLLLKPGNEDLVIYHQNIRGLNISKLDEISISSFLDSSHIVCLTENHLRDTAIDTTLMMGFKLGASFCRSTFKNGSTCIFVRETIYSTNINKEKYCKEKDLEVCAVRLHLPAHETCVIATI